MENMVLELAKDMIETALKDERVVNRDGKISYIMGVKYTDQLNIEDYSKLEGMPSIIVDALRNEYRYLDIVDVHIVIEQDTRADIINITIYINEFTKDKLVGTIHRFVKWMSDLFK